MYVCRYVDDLFGVIFAKDCETLRRFVIRLVDLCGFKLDPDKTPMPSPNMVILGVDLELQYSRMRGVTTVCIRAKVDRAKARHWSSLPATRQGQSKRRRETSRTTEFRLRGYRGHVRRCETEIRLRHGPLPP